MGFVESIGSKIHHLIENLFRCFLADAAPKRTVHLDFAILDYAVDEIYPFALHDIVLLLAHGAADKVASAEGIAC